MSMIPSDEEIENQMDLATESVSSGQSRWPGMTYEQGVQAALDWVTGNAEIAPMAEDD